MFQRDLQFWVFANNFALIKSSAFFYNSSNEYGLVNPDSIQRRLCVEGARDDALDLTDLAD